MSGGNLYKGTPFAGGVMWIVPLLALPTSVYLIAKGKLPDALVFGAPGVAVLAYILGEWLQSVELFEDHLLWRKWGRERRIEYAEIQNVKIGIVEDTPRGRTQSLQALGMVKLRLRGNDEVTLIEMRRQWELGRRLNELVGR